jgi:hypothetical protein
MCQQVTCRKCGKATWAGCGQHIDQALAGVPKSQRCPGHENDPKQEKQGFFSKLFGTK